MNRNISMAVALTAQGVTFDDGKCPMCGIRDESADHLLAECVVAKNIRWRVCVWTKTPLPDSSNSVKTMLKHALNNNKPAKEKQVVYTVFAITTWKLWTRRMIRCSMRSFT
ncbi:hypothetical protein HanXRQr2_Chr02g0071141 [Helianthus annuus]|uniref:Reverse transcriptase zinc-binding domain-containing protein n=1 Tax=Helianthus annuus TaxID=4232 RepID=A0A9K3JQR6_HELAN|nr:hypothetical protein HanXRQr2_Chr02g0071141 [Helianthus annuus]KAJ0578104.1 hypothetical protein HanIR_Chr05g0243631 [Helianthus annuus]KAJ0605100.1 hypothetical protein HanHA300_Chr02g0059151 [Helianthus annuus]KAJ0619116.1 hypothetical protein HanHA89_Chr02g0067701 [Helianthus annuus]KAJ0777565.1 hypothetical protein HanLR1_Chr02g0061901 [Helianthus annuus]